MDIVVFILLIVSMIWYTFFYIISVSPAKLEKKIGTISYKVSKQRRYISLIGMVLAIISVILYIFYPLYLGMNKHLFNSDLGIVFTISLGITCFVIATLIIMMITKVTPDTYTPKKENEMFGGIYQKIRHPQAIADTLYWFSFALIINAPVLLIYSILWVPINLAIVIIEEKDLIIRYGDQYIDYMKTTNRFWPFKKQSR